ncbi:MAG: aminotransferase class III-fold pyridoxal phosphate-dependent enzyme [Victivallales bacterium]
MNKTQTLYLKAKKIIPGGTQLLSKRPEMFAPGVWPPYYSRAKGCEVWDLDGNHYYDMSLNGIASCLLGYNDPDVSEAAKKAIDSGCMSTLNPPEEVELSEKLCSIHPWAKNVRLARSGGEAMAVAVRIARATTKRSKVAVCGYHGWHDWYLAANLGNDSSLDGHLLPGLNPLGVPRELQGTTLTFSMNNREEFLKVIKEHGKKLAAVVMEPCRYYFPDKDFIELVKNETQKLGALLIFDEITIGWKLCYGGAHLKMGVCPDLAVFAKALGNGHPIAAVIGTEEAMNGAHESFISSTYWTERVGPAAALAVLEKMEKINVSSYVEQMGLLAKKIWKEQGQKHGLPVKTDNGFPCLAHFAFEHEKANELKTLFTQLMLEKGFLAGTVFYPTAAHNEEALEKYSKAVGLVFEELAKNIAGNSIEKKLRGAVAHQGFKRLTN